MSYIPSNYTTEELLKLDHTTDGWIERFTTAYESEQSKLNDTEVELHQANQDYELLEEQVEYAKELVDELVSTTYLLGNKKQLVDNIRELVKDSSFEL